MKKFKSKKNLLREFIFNNGMKQASEQTVKSLLRSIIEPIIEGNSEGVVLLRLFDLKGLSGLVKRLEFSKAGVYFYSDMGENVVNVTQDDIWESTEFAIVLAPRYCAALVWDYGVSKVEGYTNISFYLNSRRIQDVLKQIIDNSRIDFMPDVEPYSLERRENELMCDALHKIVDCLNDVEMEHNVAKNVVPTVVAPKRELSVEVRKIVHEIRNNLSVIDLYSKIIEKRANQLDEDAADKIVAAKAVIEKSNHIINILLDDLKQNVDVKMEKISLSEIVQMAVELSAPKLEEKKLNISTKCLPVDVMAEESKLLGVLVNIINNAVSAMDTDGHIVITTEKNIDKTASIIIKNDGMPIRQEIQGKVFEEGFTTKKESGGSGLGLAISKNSIEAMGGNLSLLKSDEDETVFEIRLNLAD